MDEYNTGMDPEVKQYFKKIMKSFSVGLLWFLMNVTAGLYFKLGVIDTSWRWYNFVFYGLFSVTLALLILYFNRLWRKEVS